MPSVLGKLDLEQIEPRKIAPSQVLEYGRLVVIEDGRNIFRSSDLADVIERVREVASWTDWPARPRDWPVTSNPGTNRYAGGLLVSWPTKPVFHTGSPSREMLAVQALGITAFSSDQQFVFQAHNTAGPAEIPIVASRGRHSVAYTDFVFGYDNGVVTVPQQFNLVTSRTYGLTFVYRTGDHVIHTWPSRSVWDGEIRSDQTRSKVRLVDELVLLSGDQDKLEAKAYKLFPAKEQ